MIDVNPMPRKREAGLVMREVNDELLVYDLKTHEAHCLKGVAPLVWNYCDGTMSAAEIALKLAEEHQMTADEEVVWLAVRRLEKANLLAERVTVPGRRYVNSSRREVMKKLALAGGIVVATIIAPTSAAAASCRIKISCHSPTHNGVPEVGQCCDPNMLCVTIGSPCVVAPCIVCP